MQRTRGEQLRGALAQVAVMEQLLIAAGVQLPPPPAQVGAQVQAVAENIEGNAPVVGALQVQVAGIRRVRNPVTGRRRRVQVMRQPAAIVEQAVLLPPAGGPFPQAGVIPQDVVVVPQAVVGHIVARPALYDALCGQVQALGGGQISAANFLMFTRAYKDLNLLQESTPLSVVTGRVQTQSREAVLVGCIVMTVEANKIQPNVNNVGYGLWRIQSFNQLSGLFTLVEQKVLVIRSVTLTLMNLRECSVLKLHRVGAYVRGLAGEPGVLDEFGLRGLDLESIDIQTQDQVYAMRESDGAQTLVAQIVVSSESKRGTSSSSSGDASTDVTSKVAAVLFDPSIMAVTKKQLGMYTAADVVSILLYGSKLTPSPAIGTVVSDLACHLDYERMLALLYFDFGDVRCYAQCSKQQLQDYLMDKKVVYAFDVMLNTMEAAVCFKRLGLILGRLFGLHERILRSWDSCANAVVNISINNRAEYSRFDVNNSAVHLFNEIIRVISQACTSKATTAISLEQALEALNLDIGQAWVTRSLLIIDRKEMDAMLANASKSSGKRSAAEVSLPVSATPAKQSKTAIVPSTPSSLTVTAVTTSSVSPSTGSGICKFDCSTQGCNNARCRFQHLRGQRALTRAEKTQVKAEIAKYNSTPGMNSSKKIKEDRSMLG